MSVTISIRAHAHGPEGTAHRLHNEVKALLEALGYTLDGAMTVCVEPDKPPRCSHGGDPAKCNVGYDEHLT